MAKTSAIKKGIQDLLSEPAPASTKVIDVELSHIHPSDSNPRKTFDEAGIADLAKSMEEVGLIQAITVRPATDGKGYEIISGERRFRAARLLQWKTIQASIRDVTDEQMLEIQIIENLQREDVSPMEEAKAFKTLLNRESLDWLCSRIHKSKKYVTDRLKLNDLVEDAHPYVHAGELPLTHAIMISKLPEQEQTKCIERCMEDDWTTDKMICSLTTNQLKEFIEDELMVDLDKACFDLDDAELIAAAGSCATCPKRTGNQNLLFQEITEEDKCTDAGCFQSKVKAHVDKTVKETKEKLGKGNVLTGEKVAHSSHAVKVKGVVVDYSEKEPKGKNHTAIVITKTDNFNKENLGKVVYIKNDVIEGKKLEKEEKKVNGNADRNMTYEEKQKLKFTELIHPRLKKLTELLENDELPGADTIALNYIRARFELEGERDVIALAAMLGLYNIGGSPEILWDADDRVEEWTERMTLIDRIIEHLQPKGLPVILSVLAMLHAIDDEDAALTPEERIEQETANINWEEILLLIEPPAAAFVKSRKKKITN